MDAIQRIRTDFPFGAYVNTDQERYLDLMGPVLRHLKPPAKILDFGAGAADKTAVFSLLGFECSAVDDLLDDWHLLPGHREKILDFTKKYNILYYLANGSPLPFKPGEFDLLMMHHVLEHLHDSPRDLLNDLLYFVRPEGYLFITVPNAVNLRKRLAVLVGRSNYPAFDYYYWNSGRWRGHVREYVKDDLIKLSDYLGLEILELYSLHQMLRRLPNIVIRKLFIALTLAFPGLRDTLLLLARKRSGWMPVRSIPK